MANVQQQMNSQNNEEETVADMIEKLNRQCANREWIVCMECNRLNLGAGHIVYFSKGQDEQGIFCDACTAECDECGERYLVNEKFNSHARLCGLW